jgi:hypothetical protein
MSFVKNILIFGHNIYTISGHGLGSHAPLFLLVIPALVNKGQECNLPGALDGRRDFTLVFGAISGLAARADFAILDNEAPQHIGVFIVNYNILVGAELADFRPRKIAAFSTLAGFVVTHVIHGRLTPCPKKLEGKFVFAC